MGAATRSTYRTRGALALSMIIGAAGAVSSFAPAAMADEVSPTGKGIAGGALLGGEVVAITESLIGVRQGWAYALGGGLGAVGGGIGGYFIEQSSNNGQASVYVLAGGMALIIPALVLSLNATRYHPSEGATEDKPPVGVPANPGIPGGSAVTGPGAETPAPAPPPPPAPAAAPPPTSLLDVRHETGFRVGVPVPEVKQMYSAVEQKTYGLPQHAEVRMPVFRVSF